MTDQNTLIEAALLPADTNFSAHDREVLRRLAGQVAELAARPIEDEKRDLWRRHNRLEATRPLIFCDPENSWNEIFPASSLACEAEVARAWERHLRKQIFWGARMLDDYTIQPYFNVGHVHGKPNWGLVEVQIGGEHGGAYTWDSPVKSEADLDRLHFPQITIDYAGTARLAEIAHSTFGDLLTVRVKTAWWWTLGMTWTLANLRGMEQMMIDMMDQPDLIHRMMAFLRDGTMKMLDDLEAAGLLSANTDGTYVGSGALGWNDELAAVRAHGRAPVQTSSDDGAHPSQMWGFAESQETVAISPRMYEEFVFPYQYPVLDRFALNCYGCCEPLDKRWHVVKRFPRLRRVSISPWANRERMAENLGDQYIFSMKPNPAELAYDTVNEERVRATLRHDLEVTRGCRVEVVMKDNHTIRNDPQRVIRWVQIAREEIERLGG